MTFFSNWLRDVTLKTWLFPYLPASSSYKLYVFRGVLAGILDSVLFNREALDLISEPFELIDLLSKLKRLINLNKISYSLLFDNVGECVRPFTPDGFTVE
jgi:hypothetical protein